MVFRSSFCCVCAVVSGLSVSIPSVGMALDLKKAAEFGHSETCRGEGGAGRFSKGDVDIIRGDAVKGVPESQTYLGLAYQCGWGVPQDYKKSVAWYRKAAKQGYAGAQNNLAAMYHEGRGISQNNQEAFEWYIKAAEQGHAGAQYNLGGMYKDGDGLPQDRQEALRWYLKSAAQDFRPAKAVLENLTQHW